MIDFRNNVITTNFIVSRFCACCNMHRIMKLKRPQIFYVSHIHSKENWIIIFTVLCPFNIYFFRVQYWNDSLRKSGGEILETKTKTKIRVEIWQPCHYWILFLNQTRRQQDGSPHLLLLFEMERDARQRWDKDKTRQRLKTQTKKPNEATADGDAKNYRIRTGAIVRMQQCGRNKENFVYLVYLFRAGFISPQTQFKIFRW